MGVNHGLPADRGTANAVPKAAGKLETDGLDILGG